MLPRKRFLIKPWVAILLTTVCVSPAISADLSTQYQWKPVRIGGGGFVVGMSLSRSRPNVLFCRTDVGNAYKWNGLLNEWIPLKVHFSNGSGIPGSSASAPAEGGEESIAVDPSNPRDIFMAFPTSHSADVGGSLGVNVYKSADGGTTFTAGDLNVAGDPNGANRCDGERLAVDPANDEIVYYGSEMNGLFRSVDSGVHWNAVTGGSAPGSKEIINVIFDQASGSTNVGGLTATRVLYVVQVGGDVYRSADAGMTWSNITFGTAISGSTLQATIDRSGKLYVVQENSRSYWRYDGNWKQFHPEIDQSLDAIAVDPADASNIWCVGADTSLSRSSTGGNTWTNLGSIQFANKLGWLPQTVGMPAYPWHSNGGIGYDADGNLWICCGQEGMLRYKPTNTETSRTPPLWTITSTGIEEQVAEQAVIPPGSNDEILVSAEDTTGFVIPNPDNFSARQIPLQQEIIAQGSGIAFCPNAPGYCAVTSSNVYSNGPNYSGYSVDSGKTWMPFGAALTYGNQDRPTATPAGSIAISARGGWSQGSDHIVIYPLYNFAPQWSHDGGKTWHVSTSFPLSSSNALMMDSGQGYQGFWSLALHQQELESDPFVPDRFYLKLVHGPNAGFYVSADGGVTWQNQARSNLPDWTHHGKLATNFKLPNDLWFVDGYEGASEHGVWHSTDGGATFARVPGFDFAIAVALGAGSKRNGSEPYSAYVYGKRTTDPAWGVFQSDDGGTTWNRICYYPDGIFDAPSCMTASWDTYGMVCIGFNGNSWVYSRCRSVQLK